MGYKDLEGLGLTGSEVAVYIALLKIGQSSTGKIIKEAGISGGKVYIVLDKLIDKGLVGYILKNGVRYFSASSPEKLRDYVSRLKKEVEDKGRVVEKLIPGLNKLGKERENYSVEIFMGLDGIKGVLMNSANLANKNFEYTSMGVSGSRSEVVNLMWHQFLDVVARKGIIGRVIVSDVSRVSASKLSEIKKAWRGFRYRALPGFYLSPIITFGDKVFIINWENLSIIVITSCAVARQFGSFFDSLWEIAG